MNNTLFAIGEALIDFIPSETGCSFAEVKSFSPKIGGAPANVLGAFAKLGGKTQLITQLGDDPFGHKIADELEKYNIGIKNVKFTNKANTALAFVSLEANGNREFSFYRNPSADMLYSEDNLSGKVFDDCFALHFCSVSLGNFPMKQAHNRAIDIAAESGAIISFDPNVRLPLWNDAQMALKQGTEVQTRLCGGTPFTFDFCPQDDYYLKAHLFGDIFAGDILTPADREIVTVAALMGLKGVDSQLASHKRGAVAMGNTAEQVDALCNYLQENGIAQKCNVRELKGSSWPQRCVTLLLFILP